MRIFERDNFTCAYCGQNLLSDVSTFYVAGVDHVRPRSKGGSNDLDNLAACCHACNQLKADFAAESIDHARAYVAMKRMAFLGYFARTTEFYGIKFPAKHTRGIGDVGSFHADIAASLSQFTSQAAQIIDYMAEFKANAERALSRFEVLSLAEAIHGHMDAVGEPVADDSRPNADASSFGRKGALGECLRMLAEAASSPKELPIRLPELEV